MQFKQIYADADTASEKSTHAPGLAPVSDSPDRYFMPYVPNKTEYERAMAASHWPTHPVIEMQSQKKENCSSAEPRQFSPTRKPEKCIQDAGSNVCAWLGRPAIRGLGLRTWDPNLQLKLDQDWISNVHSVSAVNPLKIVPQTATTAHVARTVLFRGCFCRTSGF